MQMLQQTKPWLVLFLVILGGCANRPYQGSEIGAASFLARAQTQQMGSLQITAALPSAYDTEALTGLDLYQQGIQPIWLEIKNTGTAATRAAIWSIDRNYYSPIEVAYKNRKKFSEQGYADMQRWFHKNGLERHVPAGETRSGLVFTHLTPGSKGFNLDLFGADEASSFTFFLPLPGFTADHSQVDFDTHYAPEQIRHLDKSELKRVLETELSCCATDATGKLNGGPFNVVLVGTPLAVRRSLLRGGWLETSANDENLVRARQDNYEGREPSAIFYMDRTDGNERLQVNLWLAPWKLENDSVWLGQLFYRSQDTGLVSAMRKNGSQISSKLLSRFVGESISADIDSAQRFMMQNFWYNHSLREVGILSGVGESSLEKPATTHDGLAYFSRGQRTVMFLSEKPVALHDSTIIYTGHRAKAALFEGKQVPPPNDRLHIQKDRSLSVATAVPSAAETEHIFGSNLYRKNIQPVWIQVENSGEESLFLTPMGLDRSYYTARESAHRSRHDSSTPAPSTEFEKRSLTRIQIPPNSIQSGYIFSRVDEGTKSFNVDVVGSSDGVPYTMSFFVPVPGLKLDHYEVDIKGLYAEQELKSVDLNQLADELKALPCCVSDKSGEGKGDPLNLVFIGDITDLHYAFLRAGWDETETIYASSLLKTAASAISGGSYRYSPVSALYVFGRAQDAALQRARESIHERNHLRVWLTPLRHENKPVWIGQISRDIGVHFSARTITTHKIDPDVDETREFLVEDMAYAEALEKIAYIGGTGAAPYSEPRGNLAGDPYFTDGRRVIMWLSGKPTAIGEIEVLDLPQDHPGVVGN